LTKVLYTDTELLEGLAGGRREAVASIYKLYHGVLIKWIVSRGGLEPDAEDVFQEAILILYEKAKDPEFCLTCKLGTYLFAICKRLWFRKSAQSASILRLSTEEDEFDLAGYDDDIAQHLEREERFDQLATAMDQLGSPCSELLKAFYVERKNMQEIAGGFGYTNAENAKTQKYKCLSRLRKIYFATRAKEGLKINPFKD
jgi:RNA polymerase sigma factor (sigma-70 family)